MADCSFSIPFEGNPATIINKARSTINSQGGTLQGSEENGSFSVSVFGNTIKGDYKIDGKVLNIIITDKPFILPCSALESFLRGQIDK